MKRKMTSVTQMMSNNFTNARSVGADAMGRRKEHGSTGGKFLRFGRELFCPYLQFLLVVLSKLQKPQIIRSTISYKYSNVRLVVAFSTFND